MVRLKKLAIRHASRTRRGWTVPVRAQIRFADSTNLLRRYSISTAALRPVRTMVRKIVSALFLFFH
jgi:hypothetical protein